MELMRLIHCTLVVKSFHIEKHSLSRHLVFYNEAVDIEDIREWVRSAYDQNLCLFTFCIFIFRTSGIISNVAQTIKIFISLILLCLIAFFQT